MVVCRSPQSEVDDMIWEVDEDCDGSLSWPEFQQMHHRCDNDATGKLQLHAQQQQGQAARSAYVQLQLDR